MSEVGLGEAAKRYYDGGERAVESFVAKFVGKRWPLGIDTAWVLLSLNEDRVMLM